MRNPVDYDTDQSPPATEPTYRDGRRDAAHDIETLLHEEPCDCDHCVLVAACYRLALGGPS